MMRLRHVLPSLLLLLCTLTAVPAPADEALVVIVNPDSGVAALSRTEVVNLFLGRYKKLATGLRAVPLDTEGQREPFYSILVNKTAAEINAYWARLIFSGQTTAPHQLSETQVLNTVASTPGAIGYVRKSSVDARVRIVYNLAP